MEPILKEYFPMIPSQHVKASIAHYDMPFEDALKLPSVRERLYNYWREREGCLESILVFLH